MLTFNYIMTIVTAVLFDTIYQIMIYYTIFYISYKKKERQVVSLWIVILMVKMREGSLDEKRTNPFSAT